MTYVMANRGHQPKGNEMSIIADVSREIRQGDNIAALVVEPRYTSGLPAWSGEFVATVGDGKLGRFAWNCDRSEVFAFFAILEDGTVAMALPHQVPPTW